MNRIVWRDQSKKTSTLNRLAQGAYSVRQPSPRTAQHVYESNSAGAAREGHAGNCESLPACFGPKPTYPKPISLIYSVPSKNQSQEPPLNIEQIVAELKTERDQLDKAIAAIEGLNSTGRRRGRPPASISVPKKRSRRHMSAAARKRISQATKRRWAAWRKMKRRAA